MKIVLPIFHRNEEVNAAELMEKDIPYKDYDLKNMVFYDINALGEQVDWDDPEKPTYSSIYSGGHYFICPYKAGKVEKLIDKARNDVKLSGDQQA